MTTATITLTDFLLQRIAEDEAMAQAASPSPWSYNGVDSVSGGMFYDKTRTIGGVYYEQPADHDGSIVRHLLEREADANGSHIARHDPARVLAECEAKRRIVELHPIYRGDRIQAVDTSGTDFGCELCHRLDALHSDSLIEALGYCDTLLALALPYADHPEFRPEWKS